ncbi:hypothetical protein EJ110_NYTH40850 [Nymphaea thermarum]|nr:hypothetical protein EJ110_NYTH40850 [Nymphaea thermarum]
MEVYIAAVCGLIAFLLSCKPSSTISVLCSSCILRPKLMAFLISNIIIAILVLESKFMADEYVKRNDCMLTVPRLLHTATTQPYEREAVEEEEEELEIMLVDELNRRVEDFIARFKQHLRLEAQREKVSRMKLFISLAAAFDYNLSP